MLFLSVGPTGNRCVHYVSIVVKCEHTQLVCPPPLCVQDNCLSGVAIAHQQHERGPAPCTLSGPRSEKRRGQTTLNKCRHELIPRLTLN